MPDNIWETPANYDFFTDGPPYLPKLKTASTKVAQDVCNTQAGLFDNMLQDYGLVKGAEVAAVLVYLRALAWLHQTHHWQTNGTTFYGDHLLFDRLYGAIQAEVDTTAEKSIGVGLTLLVDANMQAPQMVQVLRCFSQPADTDYTANAFVSSSYNAELCFSFFLQLAYRKLEAEGNLSLGLDNFLQGLADKNEEHLYLLKQRLSLRNASKRATANISYAR